MNQFVYTLLLLIFFAFNTKKTNNLYTEDPLPSWHTGETKTSILNFVKEVTNVDSEHFVAIPDRIAVFDNDGNLWGEKPIYTQLYFARDRVKELAPEHPEWANEQPFKAVLENDEEELLKHGEEGLFKILMATHADITTDEFDLIVKDWISKAKHPTLNRLYTDLVYQPMLELINFLHANNFKTFIVSGGGIEFMRVWVEDVYNIPPDQIVGTVFKTEFNYNNGDPIIKRLPAIDFVDDKEGKPVGIHRFIGKKPIFCSGNSDGDLAMMQWTAAGKGKTMKLYLHHTDDEREWAYDKNSLVGRLDQGLIEAKKHNWTITDMKKDWKIIYPFELE